MANNAAADKAIAALTATYPDREIATFDNQEAEARAYSADPTAPTSLLLALSKARGVPLDKLARRVLVKADAFAVASGSIIDGLPFWKAGTACAPTRGSEKGCNARRS